MLLKGFCFFFFWWRIRSREEEGGGEGSLSTEPLRREERGENFYKEQKGKNIKIEGVKGNGESIHVLGEKDRDRLVNLTRV